MEQAIPFQAKKTTLPSEENDERLSNGDLDLLLTPEQFMPEGRPRELLFEERHVALGWSGNPLLKGIMNRGGIISARGT